MAEEFCFYCPNEATLLCDGVIGFIGDEEGCVGQDSEMLTCDRPMCRSCAALTGHLCGENYHDTFDKCKDCIIADPYPRGHFVVGEWARSFRNRRLIRGIHNG